jgi:hypothetical protein
MAVKKSSGKAKSQDVSASKKVGGKKSAAKKETAPKKSPKASGSKKGAAKKAAPKKAAAPAKLTSAQADLLTRIGGAGETGYRSEKKAEQRTIDALQERKLIKRGAKDKASGSYSYSLSNTGKKHIGSSSSAGGASTPPAPPSSTP